VRLRTAPRKLEPLDAFRGAQTRHLPALDERAAAAGVLRTATGQLGEQVVQTLAGRGIVALYPSACLFELPQPVIRVPPSSSTICRCCCSRSMAGQKTFPLQSAGIEQVRRCVGGDDQRSALLNKASSSPCRIIASPMSLTNSSSRTRQARVAGELPGDGAQWGRPCRAASPAHRGHRA
jgi:hypothetical protein